MIGNSLKLSPNFPPPGTGHTPFSVSGASSSCKLSSNLTRTLRRGAFQLRVIGLFQSQTTMIRLTSCRVRRAATLPRQALKRSQISILAVVSDQEVLRLLPYTGKIQSHFESQFLCDFGRILHFAEHMQKNQPHMPFPVFVLSDAHYFHIFTMLHSFPLRVAIDFGSPHHYYPCSIFQDFSEFRFSGYAFTTLCTMRLCSGATHSGVLALYYLRLDKSYSDYSDSILILYSRRIAPLISRFEFSAICSCWQVLSHGAFRRSCQLRLIAQRFARFL